jgi:hypothetical protein
MSGAGTLPPLFVITEDDHGGYVCVALYTLLVLMVVTVIARLFTRWYIVRVIKLDDIVLAFAMVGSPPTQTEARTDWGRDVEFCRVSLYN